MAGSINPPHKAFRTVGLALAALACLLGPLAQPAAAQTNGNDDGAHVSSSPAVSMSARRSRPTAW